MHKEKININWVGKNSAEKDLGFVVDHKLNRSRQVPTVMKKRNITGGWIKGIIVWRTYITLYSALKKPQLEVCIQFWEMHFKKAGFGDIKSGDVSPTEKKNLRNKIMS